MSKMYSCRPSEILKIEDDYTSFCFDEACAFIMGKLLQGEKPRYREFDEEVETKVEFKNFTEFYNTILEK